LRTVLEREWTVHRLLSRERILGLDMLKGRKAGGAEEPTSGSESEPVPESPAPEDVSGEADARPDTAGLPLFGGARREQ
jgi:hypothetical protein